MDAAWLVSPAGQAAIAAAEALPTDPLAAAAALRQERPDLTADQAATVLGQVDLRRLARDRYGIQRPLLWTRDGLEQATRPAVAAHRAALLAASGTRRVIDATAGLGLDSAAFVAAGLEVIAIERDPEVAALCAHNVPEATVLNASAQAALPDLLATLAPTDVLFFDPARRVPGGPRNAAGRAHPERDPERWSPPWSFIAAIGHPRIAVKAAPAFTPPPTWHAEWVSWQRTVVECAGYSWPVFAPMQRAVILDDDVVVVDRVDTSTDPVPVSAFLVEPDPAIIRSHAIDALTGFGLQRIDADGVWLTSQTPLAGSIAAALRQYRVITELTGSITEQRRTLDRLAIGSLTVKSRDAQIAPAVALRELRRPEGSDAVLVLARRGGRIGRWLTQPVTVQ